jgi:hypothetical protein
MEMGALANSEVGDVRALAVVHGWGPEISGPRREYMEYKRENGSSDKFLVAADAELQNKTWLRRLLINQSKRCCLCTRSMFVSEVSHERGKSDQPAFLVCLLLTKLSLHSLFSKERGGQYLENCLRTAGRASRSVLWTEK